MSRALLIGDQEEKENHGPAQDESGHRIADEASEQEEPANPKKQMARRGRGEGSKDRCDQYGDPARHYCPLADPGIIRANSTPRRGFEAFWLFANSSRASRISAMLRFVTVTPSAETL